MAKLARKGRSGDCFAVKGASGYFNVLDARGFSLFCRLGSPGLHAIKHVIVTTECRKQTQ
jgi:hypothetical protein